MKYYIFSKGEGWNCQNIAMHKIMWMCPTFYHFLLWLLSFNDDGGIYSIASNQVLYTKNWLINCYYLKNAICNCEWMTLYLVKLKVSRKQQGKFGKSRYNVGSHYHHDDEFVWYGKVWYLKNQALEKLIWVI